MQEGPQLESMKLVFSQRGDTIEPTAQILVVEIENTGGGCFFVLNTERWSFDTMDDLRAILRQAQKAMDFVRRVNDELGEEENDE